MTRRRVRVNEFDQNKENNNSSFSGGAHVFPVTADRKMIALQTTISAATNIDETKRTISQVNRGGDSSRSKYSLEIEDP